MLKDNNFVILDLLIVDTHYHKNKTINKKKNSLKKVAKNLLFYHTGIEKPDINNFFLWFFSIESVYSHKNKCANIKTNINKQNWIHSIFILLSTNTLEKTAKL